MTPRPGNGDRKIIPLRMGFPRLDNSISPSKFADYDARMLKSIVVNSNMLYNDYVACAVQDAGEAFVACVDAPSASGYNQG